MAEDTLHEIFISWSGRRSLAISEQLSQFFFRVLHARSFISAKDIEPGAWWKEVLTTHLLNSKCGIVVLTPENRYEPWLQFEAAALRFHEKDCAPIFFGQIIGPLPGPMQTIQCMNFNKKAMINLAQSMNNKLQIVTDAELSKEFSKQWPRLKKSVDTELNAPPESLRVLHETDCPKLPLMLEQLGACWTAAGGGLKGHYDYKLHTFAGIDEIKYKEYTAVMPRDNREAVYHMWADTEYGGTIAVRLQREPKPHHIVRFNNVGRAHPSNVAFRPVGRGLLRSATPNGFTRLGFHVRIPPLGNKGTTLTFRTAEDADAVQIAIRIVDRYHTHWKLVDNAAYDWKHFTCPAAEDWQSVEIPLANSPARVWAVFEDDGNRLYHPEYPDFTVIEAVVLEFGKSAGGPNPVPGGGVVEVADFTIDTEPLGTPLGGRNVA